MHTIHYIIIALVLVVFAGLSALDKQLTKKDKSKARDYWDNHRLFK